MYWDADKQTKEISEILKRSTHAVLRRAMRLKLKRKKIEKVVKMLEIIFLHIVANMKSMKKKKL